MKLDDLSGQLLQATKGIDRTSKLQEIRTKVGIKVAKPGQGAIHIAKLHPCPKALKGGLYT